MLLLRYLPLFLFPFLCGTCTSEVPSVPVPDFLQTVAYYSSPTNPFAAADRLRAQPDYAAARTAYQTTLNSPDLLLADSLYGMNQMAYCSVFLKDTLVAEQQLQRTADLLERAAPNAAAQADYQFSRAKWQHLQRNFLPAREALQTALAMYDSLYPAVHLRRAETLHEIGFGHWRSAGDIDSSYFYIDGANEVFYEQEEMYGHALDNELLKADMDNFNRKHDASIARLDRGITYLINQSTVDSLKLVLFKTYKGKMLRKINEFEKSIKLLDEAVTDAKSCCRINPEIQITYQERILPHIYKPDSAYFFSFYHEIQHLFPKEQLTYFHPKRMLALYYFNIKKYQKCVDVVQSDPVTYMKYADNPYFIKEVNYVLNESYTELEKFDSAAVYLVKKIVNNHQITTNNLAINHLSNIPIDKFDSKSFVDFYQLTRLLFRQYQKSKDVMQLKEAYQIVKLTLQLVKVLTNDLSNEQLLIYLNDINDDYGEELLLEVCFELYDKEPNIEYVSTANQIIELRKFSNLQRVSSVRNNKQFNNVPDSIKQRIVELKHIIETLRSENDKDSSIKLLNYYQDKNRLFAELKNRYPRYYNFIQDTNSSLSDISEIQKTVSKKSDCILQYYSGNINDFLLVIHPNKILFLKLKNSTEEKQLIHKINQFLRNGSLTNIDDYKKVAYECYKKYIEIIPTEYLTNINLVIIPTNELILLPFEALLTDTTTTNWNNQTPFLIYKYPIRYSYSMKKYYSNSLVNEKDFMKTKVAVFAHGNHAEQKGTLANLPYSIQEAEAIQSVFPNQTEVFTNQANTKENFLFHSQREDFRVLHLSLHAEADAENRFNNCIYWYSSDTSTPDTLFGFDIAELYLQKDLVVLSGCQTAFGTPNSGEGIFSLTRSFLESGVATVISSLWQVEDYSTAAIIKIFYQQLAKGKTPAAALQQAKIQFIQKNESLFSNPYYWSFLVQY